MSSFKGESPPSARPPRLWRYHKPSGLVVSHKDSEGRPTIFEALKDKLPRVVSVGRLDLDTEGLLLLTNDGETERLLELPATGWVRRYRVRVKGKVDKKKLDSLKDGIEVDGIRYGPIEARADSAKGANSWLTIAIREGKNREVRRVCEHLGLKVARLIRVSFGPFQLGELARGAIEEVPAKALAEQLGGNFKDSDADRRRQVQRA
ncbi:MAG: pseudouridine synthase [Rhizobiales bacterium]|nr:pseudouridine synthase [Hyphomicrobiales bacterium]